MLPKINAAEIDRIMREGTELEKARVTELLAEYDEILENNPLEGFEPYQKQSDFLSALEPTKAFFGGNRAGKTEIGIVDDLIQAVDRQSLPEHLFPYKRWDPPFFCRIVSPDFTATMEGVIFTKLRKLAPKGQLKGGSWEKAYDQQRRMLKFANGSWFQFLTSEQDVDKHSGAALHRVHFDEEPPGEKGLLLYRENRMRLIDYGGQVMITMTPLFGMSWTHDDVWMRRHEPGTFAVTASIYDNPHIDPKEIEAAFAGMSVEERKSRAEGQFVHFKGLVYNEFDTATHVVSPPDREHIAKQDIVVGIDPGVRWTGIVYTAFDNDNAAVVFDEIFLTGTTVEDAVVAIQRKNREWGIGPSSYVIDPSARNRSLTNAEAVEGAYARAGIWTVHGQADVEVGVLETKRRLQTDGIVISEDCQRLLWEIPRYRMDDKADGRFAVVKENDHELDALRYALMSRPWFVDLPTSRKSRSRGFQSTYSEEEPRWDGAAPQEALPMGNFA